jgi:NAD(P)-dependent dehydrogenase (short-subunit alcohol dehydrogenase family)
MDIKGKKIVVIGGSSGMGLAAVEQFARDGAEVIAVARNRERLDAAVAPLAGAVQARALDGGDRQALDALFAATGPVDHVVLSLSGGEGGGEFRTLDLAALRRGFEAKFWAQIEAAQASVPALRAGGSLTFITSISARMANPGTAGLAAINGAIEAMIGALARELAPLRVNAVSPGVIDTAWWDRVPAAWRDQVFAEQRRASPVGRLGQPQDVAHAIRFLIENPLMTGAIVECDGGMRLL